MRFPLNPACQHCGAVKWAAFHLDSTDLEWKCAQCGKENYGFLELDVTIGHRLLARSGFEANVEGDYSTSIIFSAMALECELAHLFLKWKVLDAHKAGDWQAKEEDFEEDYRKLWRIKAKITTTAELLDPAGLDEFVRRRPDLNSLIVDKFPSAQVGTLAEDLERILFYPRNKILHLGHAKHEKADAERCYNFALLGIKLFQEMDLARRAAPK